MNVSIFKTSVSSNYEIEQLRASLNPFGKWNFDLEDCDRILRSELNKSQTVNVVRTVQEQGFSCEELE